MREVKRLVIPQNKTVSLRLTTPETIHLRQLIAALEEMGEECLEVDFYHNSFNMAKHVESMQRLLALASADSTSKSERESKSSPLTLIEREHHHREHRRLRW